MPESFPKYLFVDLENLTFIANSLQHLSFTCRLAFTEFRAYCAPDHAWANRATHLSRSCEKEAVDVRIVCEFATRQRLPSGTRTPTFCSSPTTSLVVRSQLSLAQ